MKLFDEKFGAQFLAGVPSRPGVYRFYDADGGLLYVGKAKDLRRRFGQYRTAGRKKRERKRRALVKTAARIAWEVCETELAAALTEVHLIQTLRPRRNVASAFPFLYPFVGIHVHGHEMYLCLTTSLEAFPAFAFHGAFRSREVTGEAFFSLARLLRFVGHPVPRHRCRQFGAASYSYVRGFRRLPEDAIEPWSRLLEGTSREGLESLAVRLLEHAGARAKRTEVQEDFRAIARFFEEEASELARARAATGYAAYPVAQAERDPLFVRYRQKPVQSPLLAESRLS